MIQFRASRILAMTGLASACSITHAELFTFHATCSIEMVSPGFDGANQFPFLGLDDTDTAEFTFIYDTDTLPDLIDGGMARYSFDRDDASIRLGDSTAFFDSFTIWVGTSVQGHRSLGFRGINTSLNLVAGIGFSGISPLPSDLPTSLDLDTFNLGRSFDADSTLNQRLLPIVFGGVQTATITPAPGGAMLMGLSGLLATRRRRSA